VIPKETGSSEYTANRSPVATNAAPASETPFTSTSDAGASGKPPFFETSTSQTSSTTAVAGAFTTKSGPAK
jgi:hypothetical protein